MSDSPNEDPGDRRPEDAAAEPESTALEAGSPEQTPDPDSAAESASAQQPGAADTADPPDDGDPESAADAAAPPPRRGGRFVVALTLLIALAAAGAAGFLGWRLYRLEQRVAAIPAERTAALASYLQPDALQPLRARVESLEAERETTANRVGERVDRLQESVAAVRAMTERHQIGWRLAEIRYLLSVAARRLLIAYDTEGAEAALEAADTSIAELQDVRLLPLRKAIVEDLGRVRAVQPVDLEGIALRLQSLLARIDTLPRAPLREARSAQSAPQGGGWWQRLREEIGDFVVIQRRPSGPAPVEPREGEGLRPADALALALEDARRTALARDDAAYEAALERAAGVLQAHYDPQAGATIRFDEGLADLRGRSVETELPDLSATLALARRLAREIEDARDTASAEPPAAAAED